jgi:hypothetical protein
MPRFHLEFSTPDGPTLLDKQGVTLPTLEFAKVEANMVIRAALKDAKLAPVCSGWTAIIRDAEGAELAVIPFREVAGLNAA